MDWPASAELIVRAELARRRGQPNDLDDMAQEARAACVRLLLRRPDADERFLRVAARGAMSDWRRWWLAARRGNEPRAPLTGMHIEPLDPVEWLAGVDARVYFEDLRRFLPAKSRARLDHLLRGGQLREWRLRPIRRDIMRNVKKIEDQVAKAPDRGRWIRPLDDVITAYVQEALVFFEGDCVVTARALKIGKATIYRWIDEGRLAVASKAGARKKQPSPTGSTG